MKFTSKIWLVFGLLFLTTLSFSDDWNIGKASTTYTNEGVVKIPNTPPGTVLWAVIIGSATPQGVVGIYDSSATFTNLISSVSMAGSGNGAFNVDFQVRLSSGLSYKTTGNTGGVTFVFKQPVLP